MAVIQWGTNNALTNKAWSEGLEAEVLQKCFALSFAGKGPGSLLQIKDELTSKPGDTITYGLRMQLSQNLSLDPLGSTHTYEGNESDFTVYSDSITIDEVGQAMRWKTLMDAQRVKFDQVVEARAALSDYIADLVDTWFFNQIAGNNAVTNTLKTGNNSVSAPDSNHHIWAGTGNTADEDLASTDTFDLEDIDRAVEWAKTRSPAMRPIRLSNGGEYFVLFIHPYVTTALRASSSTWTTIQRDLLQGGFVDKNPILTGALGVYNGVILMESFRVPTGVNSSTDASISTVRRNILCGAQAAGIGWGRFQGNPNRFKWVEKDFDYGRQQGVAAYALGGLKKIRFNSEDYGTIVISSYADASSA